MTETNKKPMVSVITPVYNGERYLSVCIESVLNQSYENWEYFILNNKSTDNTLDIAYKYRDIDSRIKVYSNEEFLDIISNWNKSMELISNPSKYTKIVHADDILFPRCIEYLVQTAERYPEAGIVGSYVLFNTRVECDGLPHDTECYPGEEILERHLSGHLRVLGSPTSYLIPTKIIKYRTPFFNEHYFHADTEACYDILTKYSFAFNHQVLSFTRLHKDSQTESRSKIFGIMLFEYISMFKTYGKSVFSEKDYADLLRKKTFNYYRFLGKNLLLRKNLSFWKYQRNKCEEHDIPLQFWHVFFGLFLFLFSVVTNLQYYFPKLIKKTTS